MADDMITLGLNYGERECVDCIYVGLCRYIHMDKEQPCVFRKTDDFVPYGKLLDAEALKSHYSWLCEDAKLTKKDIDDIVDAQPSVDAVQVVRCLDCRWWKRKYTNADRIHSMSDEELAEWLDGLRGCGTCNRYHNKQYPINETLDWLRQPAGEDKT